MKAPTLKAMVDEAIALAGLPGLNRLERAGYAVARMRQFKQECQAKVTAARHEWTTSCALFQEAQAELAAAAAAVGDAADDQAMNGVIEGDDAHPGEKFDFTDDDLRRMRNVEPVDGMTKGHA